MNDRVDRAAQAVRMAAGLAGRVFDRLALTLAPDRRTPPARALSWLRGAQSPSGGILTHGGHDTAYQEVSGYLIPTFLEAGSRDVARRLFEWLTSVQRGDGAFTDPDAGRPHLFDTAQVVRGLLCFGDEARARDAVRRACEFIESRMIDGGRGGFLPQYAGGIPETVLLYALRPLRDAAHLLERPEWDAASRACLEHYEKQELDARRGELSHFLGYECEAFIEMGRADVARPVLERLATEQKEDGSLRGSAGAEWVCTPGLAQMAICWYRIGLDGPAGRAMTWLDGRVERGGEMRGSHGTGASYFPDVSIPWAHKFYLDAHRLRVESFFRRNAASFPESIGGDDGRVEVLRSGIASGDRVLDAGCGKGRFLRALRDAVPGAAFHGVDISGEMLRAVPAGIETRTGAIENLPYEDATFDVTFSVEAIEHAIDPEAAVGEMIRVTRPGGRVIVVEKQAAHAGSLKTQPWEMWPTGEAMPRWLGSGCDEVEARPVGYDGHPPDGLMMAWSGRRRSRLTGLQWNSVLVQDSERERMLERLRRGVTSPWGRAMSLATAPGDRVLEIGSGTGKSPFDSPSAAGVSRCSTSVAKASNSHNDAPRRATSPSRSCVPMRPPRSPSMRGVSTASGARGCWSIFTPRSDAKCSRNGRAPAGGAWSPSCPMLPASRTRRESA